MKKPHEQEWMVSVGPYGNGTRVLIRRDYGATVAHIPAYDPTSSAVRDATAALIAAAPDMARALMAVLEWDRATREYPDAPAPHPFNLAMSALRKAGVL